MFPDQTRTANLILSALGAVFLFSGLLTMFMPGPTETFMARWMQTLGVMLPLVIGLFALIHWRRDRRDRRNG